MFSAGMVLAAAPESSQPASASLVGTNAPTLTNAIQILQLAPEQANANLPVRLNGVVTCYDHGMVLFVQDETAGVFVYHTGERLSLKPGQPVQVTGVAKQGRYSPFIDSPVFKSLESGPAISPQPVSSAQIQHGGLDSQWVEVTGIIRAQKISDNRLWLELVDSPHRIPVCIPDYRGYEPLRLTGSVVRVRGVAGARLGDRGQLQGFQIFANAIADITVLQPAPEALFSTPLQRVEDLRTQVVRNGSVRIRGVVTLSWPGRAVFIQDATGGLEVRSQSPPDELLPGTLVDVVGYPGPILDSPLIEDALIRKLETNAAPQAIHLSSDDLFLGRYDNQLVEVEGRFLGRVNAPSNCVAFAVQAGGRLLTALLTGPRSQATMSSLESGCTLRLTGVYRSQTGIGGDSAVSLLLRSPTDVKIISPPAATRMLGVPALVGAAILSAAGFAVALWFIQKQRRQTEHLLELQSALQVEMRQSEQQLRRSVEERERIGRDLHDDIIQSIYAAGLGLEDCRRVLRQSPEQAEARLVAAIQMLNNTIRGVRGFIAGLEPKVLSGHEFKTALKSLALTSGDGPTQFQFQVDAAGANSLTSTQATQLLHIAKEAMSNSLRHSHASAVTVSLQPVSNGVRLEISDDGAGFVPGAGEHTGQGLRNMAARAREIGGELQTISAPGQGCRIVVTVPQRNTNEPD